MRAAKIASVLAFTCALAVSTAAALDDTDRSTFRGIIDRQITAFRGDDAESAYGLASPALQRLFVSPDRFMQMVRDGYRPVYRPQRYEFGKAEDTEAGPEQTVRIDDADGVGWTAIYSFERQPDGSWSISGCRLIKAPDQSV